MKKLAIAFAVLAVILGIVSFNIWRAYQDPLTATPGPVELGRQQLHQQLLDSQKREAEIEQADWGSITLLQALIKSHQQRIEKLTGNSQAGEIVAHDRDSIARLEKRIADLEAQQRALPPTESIESTESATVPATSSSTTPQQPPARKPQPSTPPQH